MWAVVRPHLAYAQSIRQIHICKCPDDISLPARMRLSSHSSERQDSAHYRVRHEQQGDDREANLGNSGCTLMGAVVNLKFGMHTL